MEKLEKQCICCKQIKPISEYYKHSQMKDGTLNKCKECQKTNSIAARNRNIEKYRLYDRERANLPHRIKARAEYQKTEAYKASQKKSLAAMKVKFAEKNKARYAVSNALRDGLIFKLPCFICGDLDVECHHPNYSKHLEVVWLCTKHHAQLHKEARQYEREKS